jgi:hypothetical protein
MRNAMSDPEEKRRKFDIKDTAKKIIEALEQYKKHHKPGEHVGTSGSRTDVLKIVKPEMQKMIKEGFTPKQLAEAIREGKVFNVRPKTITQVIAEPDGAKKPPRNKNATVSAEPMPAQTEVAALPATKEKMPKARKPKREAVPDSTAAFSPKPDSDDI